MSRSFMLCIMLALILAAMIPQVYAFSLNIEARVGDNVEIVLAFENLDVVSYYSIVENESGTVANVKASFEKSFKNRNLTATVSVKPLEFEEENYSITIQVCLSGSSVVDVSVDPKSLNRTYEVTTLWRKFELRLTEDYPVHLEEIFSTPVYEWNITDNIISFQTGEYSFTFVLPENAAKVNVDDREIISFVVPPSFVDKLVNSPLIALIGIMLVPVAALAYRRMKLLKARVKR